MSSGKFWERSRNIVDSSGWIEYFADGENASFFEEPIEDAEALVVPSISLYEVFGRLLSESDGESLGLEVVAAMQRGKVVELDSALALEAAWVAHESNLPLADGVVMATAREHGAVVWTQAAELERLPNVRYVPRK